MVPPVLSERVGKGCLAMYNNFPEYEDPDKKYTDEELRRMFSASAALNEQQNRNWRRSYSQRMGGVGGGTVGGEAAGPNLLNGLSAYYDFSQTSGDYLNLAAGSHNLTRESSYQIGGLFGKSVSGADSVEGTNRFLQGLSDSLWNLDPTKSFTFAVIFHTAFSSSTNCPLLWSGYGAGWGEYLMYADATHFYFDVYDKTTHTVSLEIVSPSAAWWGRMQLVVFYYDAIRQVIGIATSKISTSPVGMNTAAEGSTAAANIGHQSSSQFSLGTQGQQTGIYQWASACHALGQWNRVLTIAEMTLLLNGGKYLDYPFTQPTLDNSYKLVFDGDSFTGRQVYALDTLALCGRGHPYANFGTEDSPTMTTILARDAATFAAYDATCTKNVLVFQDGYNDLYAGRTGAAIYADMVTYITAAKAAGFKVALATQVPSTQLTGATETQRLALNTLINANTAGAHAIFDAAGDVALQSPGDKVMYCADGIHHTAKGAAEYSTLAHTAVLAALAA